MRTPPIFESGGNVGIGNTSPAGVLDVSGTAFVRGSLSALGGRNYASGQHSDDHPSIRFYASGNLVVDVGPTPGTRFASTKTFKTLNWVQSSTSLAAGRYYLALTMNCGGGCAQIEAVSSNLSFAINAVGGTSQSGASPATITPPVDAWGTGNQPTVVIH